MPEDSEGVGAPVAGNMFRSNYLMPYVSGGSLRVLLDTRGVLSLDDSIALTSPSRQRARPGARTKTLCIATIKPENILVNENNVRIAD